MEECKTITGPKNITLGEALALWCLMGINMPPFDYILLDGRKLTQYEYNVEKLDHWPWNKTFIFMNNLKGGLKLKMAEREKIIDYLIEVMVKIGFMKLLEGDRYLTIDPFKGWSFDLLINLVCDHYTFGEHEVFDLKYIYSYFEVALTTTIILLDIERTILLGADDVIDNEIKWEMKLRLDLLTLNALNEDDRKLLVYEGKSDNYLMFAGQISKGGGYEFYKCIDISNEDWLMRKIMFYLIWFLKDPRSSADMEETVQLCMEWNDICKEIIDVFNGKEALREWEPDIPRISSRRLKRRINEMMSAEQFTAKILYEVFYYGFGDYYFKKRFEDIENIGKEYLKYQIEEEIYRWHKVFYRFDGYDKVRADCYDIIQQVKDKLQIQEAEKKKIVYCEDENDPKFEFLGMFLRVPWWRILFEYRRMNIDKRLEEEKKITIAPVVQNNSKIEKKNEITVDKSKPVSIDFVFNGKDKKNINVIIEPLKDEKIPHPRYVELIKVLKSRAITKFIQIYI
jgi:hypothetical protein